ncbi:hypothetical protein POM88_018748 [Heracleum sosnowskyi]|uniref:Uncharacterized protein n=1 Tax=Heracleum sosnowskyi TaxID=360622 RepID=A0AAD8MV09_9APIA|nr:hypothetical protein POM88_018748 [Heracleum sosnowskyi]
MCRRDVEALEDGVVIETCGESCGELVIVMVAVTVAILMMTVTIVWQTFWIVKIWDYAVISQIESICQLRTLLAFPRGPQTLVNTTINPNVIINVEMDPRFFVDSADAVVSPHLEEMVVDEVLVKDVPNSTVNGGLCHFLSQKKPKTSGKKAPRLLRKRLLLSISRGSPSRSRNGSSGKELYWLGRNDSSGTGMNFTRKPIGQDKALILIKSLHCPQLNLSVSANFSKNSIIKAWKMIIIPKMPGNNLFLYIAAKTFLFSIFLALIKLKTWQRTKFLHIIYDISGSSGSTCPLCMNALFGGSVARTRTPKVSMMIFILTNLTGTSPIETAATKLITRAATFTVSWN